MVTPNINGPIDPSDAAGNKAVRKPTTVPPPAGASPELSPRPQRRTFSAAAKRRILEETDRAADTGRDRRYPAPRGALLVSPDRLAPPAGCRCVRGAQAAPTRPQARAGPT